MRNVPKIVLHRLQSNAESHPDADLLTAFAEQSLAERERDHVMQHLARCRDCREVVALALPAMEEVVVAHSGRAARGGWLSWPVLRWGFVAAGILAVTSIGVLQYRQRHQEKALVATSLASGEPLPAAQGIPPAPHASVSPMTAPQTETRKQAATQQKTQSSAPSALPLDIQVSTAKPILPQPRPMQGRVAAGGTFVAGSGAGQAPAAAPVSPQLDVEFAESSSDQSETVGKAKPALAQASAARMKNLAAPRWTISNSGSLQRSLDGGKTWQDVNVAAATSMNADLVRPGYAGTAPAVTTQTTVEVSAAAPLVETEASSEAIREPQSEAKSAAKTKSKTKDDVPPRVKSTEPVPAPAPATSTIFRALAVFSDVEVWAGGSGAALYHTVDGGNRWFRVLPSDTRTALTGDIVSIQFSDARHGTVRTSTTEAWATLDDGQTWHKQQ